MNLLRAVLFAVVLLAACDTPSGAQTDHAEHKGEETEVSPHDTSSEVGIVYREGKGLEVTAATKPIVNIQLATVEEGTLSATLLRTGHVYRVSDTGEVSTGTTGDKSALVQVSVKVPPGEAKAARVGGGVLVGEKERSGRVTAVKPFAAGGTGDAEILIEFEEKAGEHEVGSPVSLRIESEASEAATLIPREALLETVNGSFVYVPNGRYFFRTAVKVGRKSEDRVQVVDGLYAGDEVVKEPVMTLWLSELQAIKGGVSCADGH